MGTARGVTSWGRVGPPPPPPPYPGDEGAAPRAAPPQGARGLCRRRPIQELDGGTARRATARGTATASATAVAPSRR